MSEQNPEGRFQQEVDAVVERYAKRGATDWRYNVLNPAPLAMWQERQRAIARLWRRLGWLDLSQRSLVDVGCGSGSGLLDCMQLGFSAANLQGIELLPERAALARTRLPAATRLHEMDATQAPIESGSQDVVSQFTVFSSLLDPAFQENLARSMWEWVRPGGGVLWYDFTVNNPRNPDVRGVSVKRIAELFPNAVLMVQRLTLAPPIARPLARLHPAFYTLANIPPLRTHVLVWISKDARSDVR